MKLQADVVILDPPRSGMHDKALADVIAALPPRIVYVSCNYKNFAREMVELTKYYDVAAMRAIDMFPHTPHVELVTALVKK
jgi:tRNA/tmRNA/rRNA uracil-C5-methylase (TrmA/RlmC/RlmD family)